IEIRKQAASNNRCTLGSVDRSRERRAHNLLFSHQTPPPQARARPRGADSLRFLEARIVGRDAFKKAIPTVRKCAPSTGTRKNLCFLCCLLAFAIAGSVEGLSDNPLRKWRILFYRVVRSDEGRCHQIPAHKRERGGVAGFHGAYRLSTAPNPASRTVLMTGFFAHFSIFSLKLVPSA